jgi:hypothetical protein
VVSRVAVFPLRRKRFGKTMPLLAVLINAYVLYNFEITTCSVGRFRKYLFTDGVIWIGTICFPLKSNLLTDFPYSAYGSRVKG